MQKLILFTFLLVIILVIPVAGSGTFVVARGDPVDYYGFDSPSPNSTEPFRIWLFGSTDGRYGTFESMTNLDQYNVAIPAGDIELLDTGKYIMYIQFPGPNHQFDVYHENSTIRTIYKAIPDVSTAGMLPASVKTKADAYLHTPPVDDIIITVDLSVEEPSIRVRNMYTTQEGDLHMDLLTNLKSGDKISAMIDEDTYNVPAYRKLMSASATVAGTSNRSFSLDFTSKAAQQLPSGMHFISVRFLDDGLTTIPVERYSKYIPPTPTPVLEYYYNFNGEMLGYDINTTRPATPAITVSPTQTPINYLTVLNVKRVAANNRTIEQRDFIYLGEKNLDIYGTLGWMDTYKGKYGFTVQYCELGDTVDDTTDIVQIKDPHHFDVDLEIFGGRIGAWCQHQASVAEKHPPIAFVVMPARAVYNMTTGEMDNGLIDLTNRTGVKDRNVTTANSTAMVNVTPTEDVLNVYITPTTNITTVPTPEPIPTTESIVLPLPAWIVVAAVAIGAIVCRK